MIAVNDSRANTRLTVLVLNRSALALRETMIILEMHADRSGSPARAFSDVYCMYVSDPISLRTIFAALCRIAPELLIQPTRPVSERVGE